MNWAELLGGSAAAFVLGLLARPALERLRRTRAPEGRKPFDADAEEARRRVQEKQP